MMARIMAFIGLGVSLLIVVLAGPAAEEPAELRMGWPSVALDRRILILGTGEASAEIRTSLRVSDVPARPSHEGISYVMVRDVASREIVGVLASPPQSLPRGDTIWQTRVSVLAADVDGKSLSPGNYTVQAILVVGPGSTVRQGVEGIANTLKRTEGRPPFALRVGSENAILVLGDEPEKVRAYEAEIATGKADLIYRGLSQLVMHYRARKRHDMAELAVRKVLTDPRFSTEPPLTAMRPVLRSWIADDRFQAGDLGGAEAILETEIAAAPDNAAFLGQPFAARALLRLARMKRLAGDPYGAIADYTRLIDRFGSIGSALDAMHERGKTYLEMGDLANARADFDAISKAGVGCRPLDVGTQRNGEFHGASRPNDLADDDVGGACPSGEVVDDARRLVRIIDSDRHWYRERPELVVTALREALRLRDLGALDAIASKLDMKIGASGSEGGHIGWDGLRPHLAKLLREADALELQEPLVSPSGRRWYLLVHGIGDKEGLPTQVVLIVERTAFGWQMGAVWGLVNKIELTAGPPSCPAVPISGRARRVNLKAPWLAGEHLRAGGLDFDVDWASYESVEAAFNVAVRPILSFDHCGPGIPGYYYNTGGHEGVQRYAIDYMGGYGPIACFDSLVSGEVCIPDPSGPGQVLADLLDVVASGLSNEISCCDPTEGPAHGIPLLAAHAGVVVDADFQYADGSTEDANRVDLAIWPGAAPVSPRVFAQAIVLASSRGAALAATGAPFWLKYLHLSRELAEPQPSLGMWVRPGEVLGFIDDTGESFISHLHFEVRERPQVDQDASNEDLWPSTRQIIQGDSLGSDDNRTCIRSENELSNPDRDQDGIPDHDDNCILVFNPDQADAECGTCPDDCCDGIGDACADDFDNDGIPNSSDSCPNDSDAFEECDDSGCTFVEFDADADGTGDPCDPDSDGDGIVNSADQCQGGSDVADQDGDGTPDGCDPDRDGDRWQDRCHETRACGCVPDMFPCDPHRAGDYDGDGTDSLDDDCPCEEVDEVCFLPDPSAGPDDLLDVIQISNL